VNEDRQTEPKAHRIDPYEDEIELMDYLLVIWKWKYLIIVGTLVFALAAAIISFITWKQQPTMYRTNIVLKPGVLKIDKTGNKVFIDSPQNIKTLIENDLKHKISDDIKSSNSTNMSTSLDFQVDIPKGSNTIIVSLVSSLADEGTTKLDYLIKYLSAEFANKIKIKEVIGRKEIEKSIDLKKHEFDKLSFKEKSIKAKIEIYQQELAEIESIIKILRESKDFTQSKEYILNKLSIENDYRSTYQKYFELNENAKFNLFKLQKKITKVSNEIKDLEKTKDNIKADPYLQPNLFKIQIDIMKVSKELEKLEKGKNNIQNDSNYGARLIDIQKSITIISKDIEKLEKKKLNIQNIQVAQPPVTTEIPKTDKIKRNVALSLVLGLFLMIFLSFFQEYLSNYKKRSSK